VALPLDGDDGQRRYRLGLTPKAACFWILGEEHRRPACELGVLFRFDEREHIDQSPHGRDGHAPFLRDAKSNFKETLV
jgi:hypothetical protein